MTSLCCRKFPWWSEDQGDLVHAVWGLPPYSMSASITSALTMLLIGGLPQNPNDSNVHPVRFSFSLNVADDR